MTKLEGFTKEKEAGHTRDSILLDQIANLHHSVRSMLTHADACWPRAPMLTHADPCWPVLAHADPRKPPPFGPYPSVSPVVRTRIDPYATHAVDAGHAE